MQTAHLGAGRIVRVFVVALLMSVALAEWLHAQPGEEPAGPPLSRGGRTPEILSDGTLRLNAQLWMLDDNGNPVFVPEESWEAYLMRTEGDGAGSNRDLPAVALERVRIEIDAGSNAMAQVTGEFSARLMRATVGRLNIQFSSVQLDEWNFTGDAERNAILAPGLGESGWQWIFSGEAGAASHAILKGVSRVDNDAGRRSLRLKLPAAPCKVSVTLPGKSVDLRVRNEDILESQEHSAEQVQATVLSSGGEFLLTWRDGDSLVDIAAVEARSETRFEITDPTMPWIATTTLSLRWYGQEATNQVRIQLPSGAAWRALPGSQFERYRISSVETPMVVEPGNETGSDDQAPVELILENFETGQNQVIEQVLLEWEWLPPELAGEAASTEIQIPVPIIHGVDHYEGAISCTAPTSYAVVFREGKGARLILQGPLVNEFGRQQLQFEFDRHPFELAVSFRREQSLPTVRPTYLVQVDENKLLMTMWLDCSFDTSQPMELGIVLDEWLIQENTARLLSDPSKPFSDDGELLRISAQVDRNYIISRRGSETGVFGTSRNVEQVWRVVAERSWTSEENNELYFRLPQIARGRLGKNQEPDHGSGALLVNSASNMLLQWNESAGTGLQRDSFSTEYQSFIQSESARPPLAYRFQSGGDAPAWAGKASMLPQQISLDQRVDLEVEGAAVSIDQDFSIQVANEPIRDLRFAVRKDVGDFQQPQVFLDNNLTTISLVGTMDEYDLLNSLSVNRENAQELGLESLDDGTSGSLWQIYQLIGAPELIGGRQLTLKSGLIWRGPEAGSNNEESITNVSVPLALLLLPSDTRRQRQTWTLQTDPQVESVASSENGATQDTVIAAAKDRPLAEMQSEISLKLRPRRVMGSAAIRIGKSWLQSEINRRQRRDRFVAEIDSKSRELRLKLPPRANVGKSTKVAVDGVEQLCQFDPSSEILIVPLGVGTQSKHIVEVSYFLPDYLSWMTKLSIEPPQIIDAEQSDRFYWQLATPSVYHLGWPPAELSAEWNWRWSGFWWARRSEWNQAKLEKLIGTVEQDSLAASANSYVMSGRRPVETAHVWVLSRVILWFPVGAVAIFLSFVALNFTVVRKPVFMLAIAIVVGLLGMLWPDMAALVGQTAVLALGLVVLVMVMQSAVDSRVRKRSVFTNRPSTYIDRSDQYSLVRGVRPAAPATTHAGSSVGAHEG